MRRTRFDDAPCPIARATDLIGDWWTPIVLRDAMFGRRRFEDFQSALGMPRAILARRLARLVDEGLMAKVLYEERPRRYEYRLTEKGRAFFDVLAAMWTWGADWLWRDGGPPLMLVDRETRREVRPVVVDEATGQRIDVRRLRAVRARRDEGRRDEDRGSAPARAAEPRRADPPGASVRRGRRLAAERTEPGGDVQPRQRRRQARDETLEV